MTHGVPLQFYHILDEYAAGSDIPVKDTERDSLASYFQLLITRVMNNQDVSDHAQQQMAGDSGIDRLRANDAIQFLSHWRDEE
ncbi:DUF2543 family protein [Tatumella sp. JGM130]|uniref:DUF2543 family protein n=1 Tax=Tatumella sp. JGM130 TaxID=2799797 RepID=UPI001BB08AE4|nr:DUF2543 family protein [Tatumella sp. JGM130]MBS0894795.1 DUF2543 family protein [Tatumella sp. JGM130]